MKAGAELDSGPFKEDGSWRDRKLFQRLYRFGALAIVPNAYPDLDTRRAKALGNVRMTIYGNYAIRVSSTALRDTFRGIIADGGVQKVRKVPVEEIFRLQRMDEIKAAETGFLR